MQEYTVVNGISDNWVLEFQYSAKESGKLVRVETAQKELICVSVSQAGIAVRIHTKWERETERFGKDPEFVFELTSTEAGEQICIVWLGYSVRLYVDNVLKDEDWPLGMPEQGEWKVWAAKEVSQISLTAGAVPEMDAEQTFTGTFQNYVLPGHNTGVGDCMPFARDGRYCLYYLFDRRRHGSKQGLGAHQWAQISSADLKTWTIHPMAVGITAQWEGSICTGSLIQKEEQIYAFYAVRMSDGSPAKLTWAVSSDGVHFEKSEDYFSLTDPYEPVSARDPMVFCDEAGLYHMLVTTSLMNMGEYGGCLAHLTSTDLLSWEQKEPFLVPGYGDQPECSDYFYWNGWYYLVFSNFGTARYRMSKEPFGPWIRPKTDELDALEVRVPKTAPFEDRRFSTGFLDRLPRGYAGNAVTHELYQRPDGTLAVKHLEEILPETEPIDCVTQIRLDAGSGRSVQSLSNLEGGLRLQTNMKCDTEGALMGIALHLADGEYRIEMDPAAGTVSIIRPQENIEYGCGRDLLKNVSFDAEMKIDLLVNGDILDLALGDGRMMTMRLKAKAEDGIRPEFYALAGTVRVTDIRFFRVKQERSGGTFLLERKKG